MTYQSSARVALSDADLLLGKLVSHAAEHDAVIEENELNDHTIFVGENTIRVVSDNISLSMEVTAASESILYFLKEASVRHLAELAPKAAKELLWQDTASREKTSALPPSFFELTVVGKSAPMHGLIRLKLAGQADLGSLAGPGLHVKLMLPALTGKSPVWPRVAPNGTTLWPDGDDALHVRYYTIKSVDPEQQTVDIDIVKHAGGLFAEWAERAGSGQKVGLLGPGGGEMPPAHARVLICGDQTALPAIARMLEHLPENVSGHVIAEAANEGELAAYLPDTPLDVRALPVSRFRSSLRGAASSLVAGERPDFAWFAGEHGTAQEMRRFFKKDLHLPKGSQFAITFWRDGAPLKAD